MFNFNQNGYNYTIKFKHEYDSVLKDKKLIPTMNSTEALLLTNDGLIAKTRVVRHSADAPNKNTARKYALTKLLKEETAFNKETRTKCWEAYFEKRHGHYE